MSGNLFSPVKNKKDLPAIAANRGFWGLPSAKARRFCILLWLATGVFVFSLQAQSGDFRKQAEKAMLKGDFAVAEKLWREALKIEPESPRLRSGLSYALYKQRKYVEAYAEAKTILKADARHARGWSLVGNILLSAGNFPAAREAFETALALNPNEAFAVAGSALLDFYENRTRSALVKMRRAVEIERREPDFVYSLAQIASRVENYKEAASAYRKFLLVAPQTDTDRRERIQGLIDFLRYLGEQKSLYDVSGSRMTTLDCEIVGNRPVVKVRLDDSRETLRFVLDTGSGMTVISDETAARLGIKKIAAGGRARAIGGDGRFDIVYGFLSSLELGEVRISNVPVYIRKFHSAGSKVDGYIGIALIAKFLATLDYENKSFSLFRHDRQSDAAQASKAGQNLRKQDSGALTNIPLRLTPGGFLSGRVELEGVDAPLNFIVDTGAGISVVSRNTADEHNLNKFANPGLIKIYGGAGIAENITSLTLPRVSFGGNTEKNVRAAVLDLQIINETTGFEQSGILGGDFLRNYKITFDFRNANLVFEAAKREARKIVEKP